jgi:hypothetical protein
MRDFEPQAVECLAVGWMTEAGFLASMTLNLLGKSLVRPSGCLHVEPLNRSSKTISGLVVPFKKLDVFLNSLYIPGVNINLENTYGTK